MAGCARAGRGRTPALGVVVRSVRPLSESGRASRSSRASGKSALANAEPVEAPKGQAPAPVSTPYFVYILSCSDGTLYVGSTSDVARREHAHNEGRGAKYTAGRGPVRVVYSESHESRSAAQKREAQLKKCSRAKKQALVDRDSARKTGVSA